jgi:hypothetical protein
MAFDLPSTEVTEKMLKELYSSEMGELPKQANTVV